MYSAFSPYSVEARDGYENFNVLIVLYPSTSSTEVINFLAFLDDVSHLVNPSIQPRSVTVLKSNSLLLHTVAGTVDDFIIGDTSLLKSSRTVLVVFSLKNK